MSDKRKHPDVIFITRPACPRCGSYRLITRTSKPQGDGSVMQYRRCAVCDTSVIVVMEPAEQA